MVKQCYHNTNICEVYIPAEWTAELGALWMWDWVGHSHYGHDKEHSDAATGSQTIQSVAAYFNDSYQTGKVNIVLIVFR
jgi:hypothetical protein